MEVVWRRQRRLAALGGWAARLLTVMRRAHQANATASTMAPLGDCVGNLRNLHAEDG